MICIRDQWILLPTVMALLIETQCVESTTCDINCLRSDERPEVRCVIYSVKNSNSTNSSPGCVVQLEKIIPRLTQPTNATDLTFAMNAPAELRPAPLFMNDPFKITNLYLEDFNSISQISIVLQHFNIVGTYFPVVENNSDVYKDLQTIDFSDHQPLGLQIIGNQGLSSTPGENAQIPLVVQGTETVLSMRFSTIWDRNTFPSITLKYLWPELRYLELNLRNFNVTHIEQLKRSAPKLNYLKIFLYVYDDYNMPDLIWTLDWDLLPWKTGFTVLFLITDGTCTKTVNLRSKITTQKIPPINVYCTFFFYEMCSVTSLDVDLSYNELETLGYWQMSPGYDLHITLNLSHNNLKVSDLKDRFNVLTGEPFSPGDLSQDCSPSNPYPYVVKLDLSYNHLNNQQNTGSDFLSFPQLTDLYLQHNNYTELPFYRSSDASAELYIKDLKTLYTLDMSHNNFTWGGFSETQLGFGEFCPLRSLSFSGNHLPFFPKSIYTAERLAYADFSDNSFLVFYLTFPTFLPTVSTKTPMFLNLSGNGISELEFEYGFVKMTGYLHHILENFGIGLDRNPINCNRYTHRMYKYLISGSRSERPEENLQEDDLPDFSFYENQWNCTTPSEWAGIALMQVPEYEYDQLVVRTLPNCSAGCFCHHSWNLGDVIVANCSNGNRNNFPETIPEGTSHLSLSNNRITLLCNLPEYISQLRVLDLSWNLIEQICTNFFQELVVLEELNLNRNSLKYLPLQIAELESLATLTLSNNMLTTLPESFTKMTHLMTVDLSGNLLTCNCDTYWMTGWLVKFVNKVKNPDSIVCFSGRGQGKRLIDLTQDEVGCSDPILHALIGVGVTFVLTVVLSLVIYKYRGHIKVWLYARFGFHPWDKGDDNAKDMDFDAFVAFCRKDAEWVVKTLKPYLEAPQCGFHLCIHDRDFVPGAKISTNIIKAIQHSRRTILVLSPDFIKSGWCDFEFQIAYERTMKNRSNHLIVVLLKDIDHKDLKDDALKLYMETNTYVRADDAWFWEKLLYALPKVPIDKLKRQQQGNNDDEHIVINDPRDIELGSVMGEVNQHDIHPGGEEQDLNQTDNDSDDEFRVLDHANPGLGDDSHTDTEVLEDNPGATVNRPKNDRGRNGAAVRYQDHISDVSSSESDGSTHTDVTSDSDSESDVEKAFKPKTNKEFLASLPPLFLRINTYNDLSEAAHY